MVQYSDIDRWFNIFYNHYLYLSMSIHNNSISFYIFGFLKTGTPILGNLHLGLIQTI